MSNYSQALERLRAVYLSEDRKSKGLVVSFDALTNYSLLGLKRFGSWIVDERRERQAFAEAVEQFQIKISDRAMPVSRLSGGNQQKVLLAKILGLDPEIIIFDEPTRGIDVGTKAQIYHLIASMAAQDRACVVISSELLEIIGLCHRVIVMRSSRIVAILEGTAKVIKRIQNKDALIPVDIVYSPSMIANAIEVTALHFTAKLPVNGTYILDSPLVTPENAAQYYFPDSPF
jgi:ABC-type sugar transport system ATPase subunit